MTISTRTITIRKDTMDIELLKKIIRMDKTTLFDYLEKELSLYYPVIDTNSKKRDYLFCEGKDKIMVIAHLDTVFEMEVSIIDGVGGPSEYDRYWDDLNSILETKNKEIFHDRVEGVMWSPEGLGADDRVGVFMILSLVRAGLRPYILFTTDEETGSQSGLDFATNYMMSFAKYNISYFMELDRSGRNDCVFYDCDNKEFSDYIKKFGFAEGMGSFTDISIISPILDTAGVNLSVGYYNEHSRTEMIDLFTMSENYDIIYYMIKENKKIEKPFVYIQKEKSKSPSKPKEEEFEIIIGDTVDHSDNCMICSTPMSEYLYAKDFGKICVDCYLELYS